MVWYNLVVQSFEEMYWVKCSPAEPARVPGVYVFKFPAGFVYVGASFRVRSRLTHHIGELQAGQHKNVRLQSAWEECGGEGVFISWRALPETIGPEELHAFEVKLLEHWRAKVGSARLLNASLHPVPVRRRGGLNKPQSFTLLPALRQGADETSSADHASDCGPSTELRANSMPGRAKESGQ